jgi:hypothetical protein
MRKDTQQTLSSGAFRGYRGLADLLARSGDDQVVKCDEETSGVEMLEHRKCR